MNYIHQKKKKTIDLLSFLWKLIRAFKHLKIKRMRNNVNHCGIRLLKKKWKIPTGFFSFKGKHFFENLETIEIIPSNSTIGKNKLRAF